MVELAAEASTPSSSASTASALCRFAISSSAPISFSRSSPVPRRAASCCSTHHTAPSSSAMSSTHHAVIAGAGAADSCALRGWGRGLSGLGMTVGGAGVGRTGEPSGWRHGRVGLRGMDLSLKVHRLDQCLFYRGENGEWVREKWGYVVDSLTPNKKLSIVSRSLRTPCLHLTVVPPHLCTTTTSWSCSCPLTSPPPMKP
jgi:hypothetical protein